MRLRKTQIIIAVTLATISLVAQKSVPSPVAPPSLAQIIEELPTCSVFRTQLEAGQHGAGVDEEYMRAMREAGIRRILFEIDAVWGDDKPQDLHIERMAYFTGYDGSSTQITDAGRLQRITNSEMQHLVEKSALKLASSAEFAHGFEHRGVPRSGEKGYAVGQLWDNGWLRPQTPIRLIPIVHAAKSTLNRVAFLGDRVQLEEILKASIPPPNSLNTALLFAAASRYDNTQVIETLLVAGADINGHDENGTTPLMNTLATPCNTQTILAHGAKLDQRDRWGNTALGIAKSSGRTEAARLIQNAASRQ